jgi:hypothetical protein
MIQMEPELISNNKCNGNWPRCVIQPVMMVASDLAEVPVGAE